MYRVFVAWSYSLCPVCALNPGIVIAVSLIKVFKVGHYNIARPEIGRRLDMRAQYFFHQFKIILAILLGFIHNLANREGSLGVRRDCFRIALG
jgi:predicted ferric reductase